MPRAKQITGAKNPLTIYHEKKRIEKDAMRKEILESKNTGAEFELTDEELEHFQPPRLVHVISRFPRRATNIKVRTYKSDIDGKTYKVEKDGEDSPFVLDKAKQTLDLDDPYHAMVFEAIKNHPRYYLTAYPLYDIEDESEENKVTIEKARSVTEAMKVVLGMHVDELLEFSRMFANNPNNQSIESIEAKMVGEAQMNPDRLINQYNNPERHLWELLIRGLHGTNITYKNGVHYFGNVIMGDTREKAVSFMKANSDITSLIAEKAAIRKRKR